MTRYCFQHTQCHFSECLQINMHYNLLFVFNKANAQPTKCNMIKNQLSLSYFFFFFFFFCIL
ncbi:hypothetical protein Hanom_Chr09g00809961 [Helianthus anomalus]